ncbi:hypothetical protein ACWEGQ_00480 [Streptomyces seoulensis]
MSSQYAYADKLATELHRRACRLHELRADLVANSDRINHVRGEVIGLRGALGIVLGGTVPGGTADRLAFTYYEQWLTRQVLPG